MNPETYFFVQNCFYKLIGNNIRASCKNEMKFIIFKESHISLNLMHDIPVNFFLEPGHLIILNLGLFGTYKEFFDFNAIVEFISLLKQNDMPIFSLKKFITIKNILDLCKLNKVGFPVIKEKTKRPLFPKIFYYYFNSNLLLFKKVYIFNQINILKKY